MLGILKPWRAINQCVDALERYGINSDQIGRDVIPNVCKLVIEKIESRESYFENAVEAEIFRASDLIALCVLGPEEFNKFKYNRGLVTIDTVKNAAIDFTKGKSYAASLDLKIIFSVAESGAMHKYFASAFVRFAAS